MPWKECHVVDQRLRFVARLLDGEKMAGLCEEFGISRKAASSQFHGVTHVSGMNCYPCVRNVPDAV